MLGQTVAWGVEALQLLLQDLLIVIGVLWSARAALVATSLTLSVMPSRIRIR